MKTEQAKAEIDAVVYRELAPLYRKDNSSIPCKTREEIRQAISCKLKLVYEQQSKEIERLKEEYANLYAQYLPYAASAAEGGGCCDEKDSLLKEAEELLQQLQYELDLSKCSDDRIKQTLSKLKER